MKKASRYLGVLVPFGAFLCVLGIGLIIGGSLSFKNCKGESEKNGSKKHDDDHTRIGRCESSQEAARLKLNETIAHVMNVYYTLFPNKIIWHAYAHGDDLKLFRPYNCSPAALKYRTGIAAELYENAKELRSNVNESELKPRELKSLIQVLHFLKSNFGQPYGENYYAGKFCQSLIRHPTSYIH